MRVTADTEPTAARPGLRPWWRRPLWLRAALVGAVVLLLDGLIALEVAREREAATATAASAAQNLARSLGQHAQRSFDDVHLLLTDIAAAALHDEAGAGAHGEFLRRATALLPQLRGIVVLDGTGSARHDDQGRARGMPELAGAFDTHRRDAAPQSRIGRPLIDVPSGALAIPVSRGLAHADGSFAGVAIALVDQRYLRAVYESLDLGAHGRVALLRGDGAPLAGTLRGAAAQGAAAFLAEPIEETAGHAYHATAHGRDPVSGRIGIRSEWTLADRPVAVAVFLAAEDYLAAWRQQALHLGLIAAAITIAIVLMAAVLIHTLFRREESETRLAESRRLLRATIDAVPARINLRGRDLRYLLVNVAHERLMGIRRDEALGKRWADAPLPHIDDAEKARWGGEIDAADRRVLETGEPMLAFEQAVARRDGAADYSLCSKIPLREADGSVAAVLTVAVDITDLKRREAALTRLGEALREKSTQLEVALSNMNQGIALYDPQHRLVLHNRRWLELYGLAPETIAAGMTLHEIMAASNAQGIHPPERAAAVTQEHAAIAERGERDVLHQWLASGRILETVHQPLPEGGFVATHTDVTEREHAIAALRLAKETAETASRSKSDFLAHMSHELRTPLNAIIGFSEALEGDHFGQLPAARQRGYARDIRTAGRHLLRIINDILDLSKVEAGKAEMVEEAVDIAAAIEDSVTLVRSAAVERSVSLAVAVADGLPPLRGDGVKLRQILVNLLANAVKFSHEGGAVAIAAALGAGGAMELSVGDAGIGMTPEDIERALTPFGQVENVYTRTQQGSGLGLPLTKSLVELHGGSLAIASAPDEGTTVSISFPAARVIRIDADAAD